MKRETIWDTVVPAAAILFPLIVFTWLVGTPSMDLLLAYPRGHFYVVTTVSFLSLVLAVAMGLAGVRLRNLNVIFLSLSFISLAEAFTVHGLATPDFLFPDSHLPGVAAQLSLTLAVMWLGFSTLSTRHPLVAPFSRYAKWLIPCWTLFLALLGTVGLAFPHSLDWMPIDLNPFQWWFSLFTFIVSGITMYSYWQSYRYTRFPLQLAMVYSSGWLIVAQWIVMQGTMFYLSWWIYHFLLLFAVLAMLSGLIRQYAVGKGLGLAVKTLFQSDPLERMAAGISNRVQALIIATESKDIYTAGHNFRVSLYGFRIAEVMGLSPSELRAMAQGGIVHDVGKIQVPDAILNKPGRLSEEERRIIERHPQTGYEMCSRLGFMKEELQIIRYHHEKWDGSGYPDHLKGEKIPLMARILAVADVYDALTSERAYREAWSHERAMEHILECQGTHFDPRCVAAWQKVCKEGIPVYEYPHWIGIRQGHEISL